MVMSVLKVRLSIICRTWVEKYSINWLVRTSFEYVTRHEKWSFPLRISSVNVIKSLMENFVFCAVNSCVMTMPVDLAWYGKTQVTSYELQVTSYYLRLECLKYELKFKSASSNPRVQIHELLSIPLSGNIPLCGNTVCNLFIFS